MNIPVDPLTGSETGKAAEADEGIFSHTKTIFLLWESGRVEFASCVESAVV